jgi:hypothetical protein
VPSVWFQNLEIIDLLKMSAYDIVPHGHLCYTLATPPNSMKDSNVSLKVKTSKKGVGVCFLICSISGIRKACWSSEMGTRISDKVINYSCGCAQTK